MTAGAAKRAGEEAPARLAAQRRDPAGGGQAAPGGGGPGRGHDGAAGVRGSLPAGV